MLLSCDGFETIARQKAVLQYSLRKSNIVIWRYPLRIVLKGLVFALALTD